MWCYVVSCSDMRVMWCDEVRCADMWCSLVLCGVMCRYVAISGVMRRSVASSGDMCVMWRYVALCSVM